MNLKGWYMHESDNWRTPSKLYEKFIKNGWYDPCPINPTKDGLTIEWQQKNFVNPPYSNLKAWIHKAIEEHKKSKAVILLIPARTDTQVFKTIVEYGAVITFITGRLKFNDKGSAPFPSCIIYLTGTETHFNLIDREELLKEN